jgi:hypothetical protein
LKNHLFLRLDGGSQHAGIVPIDPGSESGEEEEEREDVSWIRRSSAVCLLSFNKTLPGSILKASS